MTALRDGLLRLSRSPIPRVLTCPIDTGISTRRDVCGFLASESDTSTPWGDFDARANWADILEPGGWTSTNGIAWTRPGKQLGTSASIVTAKDGTEVLTVFSSAAGVLACTGTGHRTWGKFAAFAELYHGGDRSAAAKAVIAMGYGRAAK